MTVDERYLPTNSMRFHLLTAGDGDDLMLFLHGFPDAPTSMVPLLEKAAEAGYYAVAPYMRGYGKTGPARNGHYYISDLARDCVGMIDALDRGEAVVVGHDWGAVAAYAAANRSPGRIRRLVTMSVPPLGVFLRNYFRYPEQLLRSWYIFFFQLPLLPQIRLKRNDFQLIEDLWNRWSPNWNPPQQYLNGVKKAFETDWTPTASIGYYRALIRGLLRDRRSHRKSRKLSFAPLDVPSLIMTGEADKSVLPESFRGLERAYDADYQFHRLSSVGHFPHLEATNEVFERMMDYLPA